MFKGKCPICGTPLEDGGLCYVCGYDHFVDGLATSFDDLSINKKDKKLDDSLLDLLTTPEDDPFRW